MIGPARLVQHEGWLSPGWQLRDLVQAELLRRQSLGGDIDQYGTRVSTPKTCDGIPLLLMRRQVA